MESSMKRSSWLFAAALPILALFAVSAPAALAASADFTSGVASGDVTSTKAILWTRAVPSGPSTNIKLEVWKEADCLTGPKAFQASNIAMSAARDYTIKVDAVGLPPATAYCYRFRRGDEAFSDVGHFRTAPDPTSASDVKFTYTGDADGTRVAGVPSYNNFETFVPERSEGGDFWVFLGDTIYSDSRFRTSPATTLAQYEAAHRENRSYQNLQDMLASTSTYAQWDDHEVVNDFDAQTVNPARFAAGRKAYLEYYPVRESSFLHDSSCAGDPMYRTFSWGKDVEVFVLDERSCRSAESVAACAGDLAPTLPMSFRVSFPFSAFLTPTPPAGCLTSLFDPARTMLGPVQKQRFKNDLAASTAKYKVVMSEDPIQQFFVLPYDRWEGYGAERDEILNFIRDNDIQNVQFLTTDTHANMQNRVWIDRFTDNQVLANESITGPVATDTFEQEVSAVAGVLGVFAVNALMNVADVECRNLNQNSYGLVNANDAAGTFRVDLKTDTGAAVVNRILFTPNPLHPCTKTFP
jgi:alkaline phosphatase D